AAPGCGGPGRAPLNPARAGRLRRWTRGAGRCEPGRQQTSPRPADPSRSLAGRKHGGTVDSTALRAVQQPLKDAYREDPQAAVVTLEAHGQLGEENISCSVATGKALAVAGLHPARGGGGGRAPSRGTRAPAPA